MHWNLVAKRKERVSNMRTSKEALMMVFELVKEAFDIDDGCGKCESCQRNWEIHCRHIVYMAELISQTKISKAEFLSVADEFKKINGLRCHSEDEPISLDPSNN